GDGRVSAAAPLRTIQTRAARLPSAGSAGPGDGALSLSRHRAGDHARAPRRGVRGVFRGRRTARDRSASAETGGPSTTRGALMRDFVGRAVVVALFTLL